MVCQRNLVFDAAEAERSSIFSRADFVERELRASLPPALAELPLRVDLARHIHRPDTRGPEPGAELSVRSGPRRTSAADRRSTVSAVAAGHRICRIYAQDESHAPQLAAALDALIGAGGAMI